MFPTRTSRLAKIHAVRRGNDATAYLSVARQGVSKYPDDPEFLIELATALVEYGGHDPEAGEVARSAGMQSADPRVLIRAAWMLIAVGSYPEAGRTLERLEPIVDVPDLIANEATHLRGAVHSETGDDEAAERFLRDAVARDSANPSYLAGLARFLVSRQRPEELSDLGAIAARISEPGAREDALQRLSSIASDAGVARGGPTSRRK